MTRNRFNQTKQQTMISPADRRNNLSLSKSHQLFLEDNKNIDMKSVYIIKNSHPPLDMKNVVNKK